MTAERWWTSILARWLARVDGVSEMIKMSMLGLTGISTGLVTLKQYGHGEYAWHLIGIVIFGTIVFTYFYTEGGIWNQKARDTQDLSSNFAGPSDRINKEMIARSVAVAMKGRELTEEERELISNELDTVFSKYREGIDIEEKIEK